MIKKGCSSDDLLNILKPFSRISYRCQSPEIGLNAYMPRKVDLSYEQAFDDILNHIGKYDVLISETIPLQDVIYNGNVAFWQGEIIIEILSGPGTLDKLTREGCIDYRWITTKSKFYREIAIEKIRLLTKEILVLPYNNIIVECSIFNKPVGIKYKDYIAWEIINYQPYR